MICTHLPGSFIQNENTFSKIKERKIKNREHIKKKEKK